MDQPILIIASLFISLSFILPLGLGHLSILSRAAIRLALLAILTGLIFRLFGSPLRPVFQSDSPSLELWQQAVMAGWWAVTARSAVLVARLWIVLQDRPREAQIVIDLIAGAIYLAGGIGVITFVFAVPLGGLLATSGIIAIVLGLALQSTLADVFSGIAVGIERPFKAGDLVSVDGGVEGAVVQVNWRSTHIVTGLDHVTVVPNSLIAKSRVINHSRPTAMRMDKVEVRLDPTTPAERCIASLTAAARAALTPLDTPRTTVIQKALEGDGASYEVHFAVADSDVLASAKNELYGLLQRHLRHDGISLAVGGLARVEPTAIPDVAKLLEDSDLFGSLPKDGRDILAEHFSEVHLSVGEHLIEQNATPFALFILASGTVEVTRAERRDPPFVRRMSPGGTLGAIGLVTSAPYAASAVALTSVRAYRLDKVGISAAIEARAALSQELEAMAQRGQAALSADAVASDEHQREHPEFLLARVRHFIAKLAARPETSAESNGRFEVTTVEPRS